MHEEIRLLFCNAGNLGQRVYRLSDFFLKPEVGPGLLLDINMPSGQSRGQSGILSPLADCQGELIFTHQHPDMPTLFVDLD